MFLYVNCLLWFNKKILKLICEIIIIIVKYIESYLDGIHSYWGGMFSFIFLFRRLLHSSIALQHTVQALWWFSPDSQGYICMAASFTCCNFAGFSFCFPSITLTLDVLRSSSENSSWTNLAEKFALEQLWDFRSTKKPAENYGLGTAGEQYQGLSTGFFGHKTGVEFGGLEAGLGGL